DASSLKCDMDTFLVLIALSIIVLLINTSLAKRDGNATRKCRPDISKLEKTIHGEHVELAKCCENNGRMVERILAKLDVLEKKSRQRNNDEERRSASTRGIDDRRHSNKKDHKKARVKCENRDFIWAQMNNTCIKGLNSTLLTSSSIAECKKSCDDQSSNCMSISHNAATEECHLQSKYSGVWQVISPCDLEGWDYAEKRVKPSRLNLTIKPKNAIFKRSTRGIHH
ncbi:unnamed protein product, partial [Owenia fusiformis]